MIQHIILAHTYNKYTNGNRMAVLCQVIVPIRAVVPRCVLGFLTGYRQECLFEPKLCSVSALRFFRITVRTPWHHGRLHDIWELGKHPESPHDSWIDL